MKYRDEGFIPAHELQSDRRAQIIEGALNNMVSKFVRTWSEGPDTKNNQRPPDLLVTFEKNTDMWGLDIFVATRGWRGE